jgi:hypothetical protein
MGNKHKEEMLEQQRLPFDLHLKMLVGIRLGPQRIDPKD